MKWNIDKYNEMKSSLDVGNKTLILGTPGIGKTMAVKQYVEETGCTLVELNESNVSDQMINNVYNIATSTPLDSVLIYVSGVDIMKHWWSDIYKILASSINPVILEANDLYSIPDKIKDLCKIIKFTEPNIYAIIEAVKGFDGDKDFSKINTSIHDIRSAVNVSLYGNSQYIEKNVFDSVRNIFSGVSVDTDSLDNSIMVWLAHNADKYFYGSKQILYYSFIKKLDLVKNDFRFKIASLMKANVKENLVEYPLVMKKGFIMQQAKKKNESLNKNHTA